MEKIQFEQMVNRNIQAQRSAMELFKAGQKIKAVELVTEQLHQVELAQFGRHERNSAGGEALRVPHADGPGPAPTSAEADKKLGWDEGHQKTSASSRKRWAMIKQCNALTKEGKYKEALALARQGQGAGSRQPGRSARDHLSTQHPQIDQSKYDERQGGQ